MVRGRPESYMQELFRGTVIMKKQWKRELFMFDSDIKEAPNGL
jgi:hypothetical protein